MPARLPDRRRSRSRISRTRDAHDPLTPRDSAWRRPWADRSDQKGVDPRPLEATPCSRSQSRAGHSVGIAAHLLRFGATVPEKSKMSPPNKPNSPETAVLLVTIL